jgi:hypothetical protein
MPGGPCLGHEEQGDGERDHGDASEKQEASPRAQTVNANGQHAERC